MMRTLTETTRPLEHETDATCEIRRECTQIATHVVVTTRRRSLVDTDGVPHGYRDETSVRLACPSCAGVVPPIGSTVTNDDGEIGLVVSYVFPSWNGADPMVTVEWERYASPESIALLDREYGACAHGVDPSGRCGADTAPGHEFCAWHGGADPLPVPPQWR